MANAKIIEDTTRWIAEILSDPDMRGPERLTRAFHLAAILATKDNITRGEFLDLMGATYDSAEHLLSLALRTAETTH